MEKCKYGKTCMMEKTIKIDEVDWKQLYKQKLDLGLDRIADVIKQNITFSERFNNENEFRKF